MAGEHTLAKPKLKVTPWHCTPTPPNKCSYLVSTSYTLQFLIYSPDKLFPAAHLAARLCIQTPWVKTILNNTKPPVKNENFEKLNLVFKYKKQYFIAITTCGKHPTPWPLQTYNKATAAAVISHLRISNIG